MGKPLTWQHWLDCIAFPLVTSRSVGRISETSLIGPIRHEDVQLERGQDDGQLARWIKWRACDVGEAKEGLKNELWRRWSNERDGEWAVTRVKRLKGWRMNCDVREVTESLENEQSYCHPVSLTGKKDSTLWRARTKASQSCAHPFKGNIYRNTIDQLMVYQNRIIHIDVHIAGSKDFNEINVRVLLCHIQPNYTVIVLYPMFI